MTGDLLVQVARGVIESRADLNDAIITFGRASLEARDARRQLARINRLAHKLMA